ncbi:hypothetical protein KEM56_005716 [Ascosphaera pollenicola]|nr:hypothetical protein KEM56_005716 [Ascosphaera pollenicola]
MEDDLNALIAEMDHTENRSAKARIGKKVMEMAAKIIEADNQRVMAGLAEEPAEDDKKKDAGQRVARVPAVSTKKTRKNKENALGQGHALDKTLKTIVGEVPQMRQLLEVIMEDNAEKLKMTKASRVIFKFIVS